MGTFDGDAEREEEGLIAEAVRDTLLVEATLASNASDMSKDEYGEKKDMLPERVCYQVRVLSALSVVLVVAGMVRRANQTHTTQNRGAALARSHVFESLSSIVCLVPARARTMSERARPAVLNGRPPSALAPRTDLRGVVEQGRRHAPVAAAARAVAIQFQRVSRLSAMKAARDRANCMYMWEAARARARSAAPLPTAGQRTDGDG
jgi:hypothetical protein